MRMLMHNWNIKAKQNCLFFVKSFSLQSYFFSWLYHLMAVSCQGRILVDLLIGLFSLTQSCVLFTKFRNLVP